MKTTKKLLVLCLIAVMGVVAVMPSTFSWFDHSGKQSGDSMRYQRGTLPISTANVSMKTKKLQMDANDPNKLYYDSKGQKVPTDEALTSDTVNPKNQAGDNQYTQYYQTKFTNASTTADAYVNFYLTDYTNEPGLYLGTIYPTITEKNQAGQPSATTKAYDKVRVYFQDRDVNGWSDTNKYVAYTSDGTTWVNKETANSPTAMGETVNKQHDDTSNYDHKTWYADLPSNTQKFYFYSNNQISKPNDGWYRTPDINTLNPKTIYYLKGDKSEDGNNNCIYGTYQYNGLISIEKYYDTISISSGQRFKLTLPDNWYSGNSQTSAFESGSNITVNSNTGYLLATGTVNSATVTTTITGVLGDPLTLTSNVNTPGTLDSVPVILNFKIPKAASNSEPTVRDVVWYIRNKGTAAGSFTGTFFTK